MPSTTISDIHDTDTCACEQCVWASRQEQEMIASDIDSVVERLAAKQPREFADVLNEWLDTLLELNKTGTIPEVILITRLGSLGQRLIYEANALGMNEGLRYGVERVKERVR